MDDQRGNALHAWRGMGAPDYPKAAQIASLRVAAEPVCLRDEVLDFAVGQGDLTLTQDLAPCALVCWELDRV